MKKTPVMLSWARLFVLSGLVFAPSVFALDLTGPVAPRTGPAGAQAATFLNGFLAPYATKPNRVELVEGSVPAGVFAQIEPSMSGPAPGIKITVAPNSTQDPFVNQEIHSFVQLVMDSGRFGLFYEQTLNARAGSKRAKAWLTQLESSLLSVSGDGSFLAGSGITAEEVSAWRSQQGPVVATRLQAEVAAAKAETSTRERAWDARRRPWPVNDPHAPDLGALVAANDRTGVAKVLRERLPWELMEPYEEAVWSNWIDAIEHPDLSRAIVTFRGLQGDHVLPGKTAGHFFFSQMLAANRGSYVDRLRSMTRARQTLSGTRFQAPESPSSIYAQFLGHAQAPQSSPFLSFSNIDVASRFFLQAVPGHEMTAKISAYRVDPRLLMPNIANPLWNFEFEFLAPLFVFPGDEITYLNAALSPTAIQDFRTSVETKLGRALTPVELGNERSSTERTPTLVADFQTRARLAAQNIEKLIEARAVTQESLQHSILARLCRVSAP